LSLRDVLAGLPAVSALALATLYGIGVLLNVGQLSDARVSVSDALPLIALQDHLAKGLGEVFTSVVVSVLSALAFGAILLAYASKRSLDMLRGALNSGFAALDASHEPSVPGPEAAVLRDEADEEPRSPDIDAARTMRERVVRVAGAGLFVSAPLASPVHALVIASFGLLLILGPMPILQPVALLCVLGLMGTVSWVADAYWYPQPLPRVTIATGSGAVSGSLITSNGDRYVVTGRHRALVSIPMSVVRSARVVPRPRPKRESVIRLFVRLTL